MENFLIEYKYLLSILLSVLLGFAIGFERKTRAKEASVRTHTVVCFGSALMMVISKYGFPGMNADVSRVASQIITGVGFLGAGMIVYRKNAVHGLTTAAGVWATAGIGMACGAGLYFVAIGSTVILISLQCILHINCSFFNSKRSYQIKVTFIQKDKENEKVKDLFEVNNFQKVSIERGENIKWDVVLNTATKIESSEMDRLIKENPFIINIERCDDN